MRNETITILALNRNWGQVIARARRSTNAFFTARFLTGALLVAAGGGSALAQTCSPSTPFGPFLFSTPGFDPPTFSMGVFQIYVNSTFTTGNNDLFDANSTYVGGPYPGVYPGWHSGAISGCTGPLCPSSGLGGTLTSPVIYDNNTIIGYSQPNTRPTPFPQQVGSVPYTDNLTTPAYGDYIPGGQPPAFFFATPGTREVLTEIDSFTLGLQNTNCSCDPNNIAPCPIPSTPYSMVLAGKFNADSTLSGPLPRSLGIVQSLNTAGVGISSGDFPAQSFFNVFAEIHLPIGLVQGGLATVSSTAFPTKGAYLYSDLSHPLVVQNSPMCEMPPAVIYIHTPLTFAVPVYFKEDGPINPNIAGGTTRWWNQDDLFGYLSLAGHGVVTPCGMNAQQTLISTVLGTNNGAATPPPIPYPVPKTEFVVPNMTYDSMHGTNYSGLSIDAAKFPFGPAAFWMRGASIAGFADPTNLPAPNTTVVYTNPNTTLNAEFAINGTNFSTGSASGPISVLISNQNLVVDGASFYSLQILSANFVGTSSFGPVYLSISPTKASTGTEIVQPNSQGGSLIASSLDITWRFSPDLLNFADSIKPLHHQLANPPCGCAGERLHAVRQGSGSTVVMTWRNPQYKLQGSPNLLPTSWVTLATSSPATVTPGTNRFFRVACGQ